MSCFKVLIQNLDYVRQWGEASQQQINDLGVGEQQGLTSDRWVGLHPDTPPPPFYRALINDAFV